jgi:hypothetical protein
MLLKKVLRFFSQKLFLWLCLVGLVLAGCGGDNDTLVLVDYAGIPGDASGLLLLYIIEGDDGQQRDHFLNMEQPVPVDIGKFAFRLPPGTRGKLKVRIAVEKSGWPCLGGGGENAQAIPLTGQPEINVFICVTNLTADSQDCSKFPTC